MGTIRNLFVQTETFVLFLACITVKNRLSVPLSLERGIRSGESHIQGAWLSRGNDRKRGRIDLYEWLEFRNNSHLYI